MQALAHSRRVNRIEFLVEAVRGRRVLHIGCVDAGLLQDRLRTGELLHDRLMGTADELWGLDVDESGIRELSALGRANLFVGSAESPPSQIPREHFDVVVAGELIEHVRNVGLFLDSSVALLKPGGALLITTPNALRFYNSWPAFLGRELVHPDHLVWFSPHTLKRAVEVSGLEVETVYVYNDAPMSKTNGGRGYGSMLLRSSYNLFMAVVHPLVVSLFPHLSDGIIVLARKGRESSYSKGRHT